MDRLIKDKSKYKPTTETTSCNKSCFGIEIEQKNEKKNNLQSNQNQKYFVFFAFVFFQTN